MSIIDMNLYDIKWIIHYFVAVNFIKQLSYFILFLHVFSNMMTLYLVPLHLTKTDYRTWHLPKCEHINFNSVKVDIQIDTDF